MLFFRPAAEERRFGHSGSQISPGKQCLIDWFFQLQLLLKRVSRPLRSCCTPVRSRWSILPLVMYQASLLPPVMSVSFSKHSFPFPCTHLLLLQMLTMACLQAQVFIPTATTLIVAGLLSDENTLMTWYFHTAISHFLQVVQAY